LLLFMPGSLTAPLRMLLFDLACSVLCRNVVIGHVRNDFFYESNRLYSQIYWEHTHVEEADALPIKLVQPLFVSFFLQSTVWRTCCITSTKCFHSWIVCFLLWWFHIQ
jgi:hypothetical protein